VITQRELEAFNQQLAEAEVLADDLSNAGMHGAAGKVVALRQSLRACITKTINVTTVLKETDDVLSAVH
jgi:hypothetical protein